LKQKAPRRGARELALQTLYAWQLAGGEADDLLAHAAAAEDYAHADHALLDALVHGVIARASELEALIAPCLNRSFASLSPVERAVLYIGAFELSAEPATPVKVVLNEAIEIGKSYGGTDGYKFVNGVLEKLAAALRPAELARARRRPAAATCPPNSS
jgi:N utilization substance protein B